jgi:hypothetical protein
MRSPLDLRLENRRYERILDRKLRKNKGKLFQALEEFVNIGPSPDLWARFKTRWPKFFPREEYDRAANGVKPSIAAYPFCLDRLWTNAEAALDILLGIDNGAPYRPEVLMPEDVWLADVASIPAHLDLDWDEGIFRYRPACDFQRALYLLFLESWRAMVCEKCGLKFIARRAAQKYCSTDCSEGVQRELKQKWWAAHGQAWRKQRRVSPQKGKGGQDGAHKTR